MNSWVLEKDRPLGQVLQAQGVLDEEDDEVLDSLVRRLVERHGGDARRGLAAVSTTAPIREVLGQIDDHALGLCTGPPTGPADETEPAAGDPIPQGGEGTGSSRFRLVKLHARGGLGEVWVARDAELNREVALKRLREREADNPQSRDRFLHEAEVTGRLEHKGIVPVYSLGRFDNGRPYYAMRFVEGTTLKDAIIAFREPRDSEVNSVDRPLALAGSSAGSWTCATRWPTRTAAGSSIAT